jgi:hypothetical protein
MRKHKAPSALRENSRDSQNTVVVEGRWHCPRWARRSTRGKLRAIKVSKIVFEAKIKNADFFLHDLC